MKFKEGDLVSLPLNEEGEIESINHGMMWGFNHKVRITKGGVFNNVGDIAEFKEEQLSIRTGKPEIQKIMESNDMTNDSHGVEFVTHFSETVESLEHQLKLERWKHNEYVKKIQDAIGDKSKHEQRILELERKINLLKENK